MPDNKATYDDLGAVYLNCTLSKGKPSHTETLMRHSMAIMEKQGVKVELIRIVEEDIATGVYPDMTEQGWETDSWPELWKKINAADILVIGTPIWLGQISSVCMRLIERLYAMSSQTNAKGQSVFYNKTGGCMVTGNEDGVKHCAMHVLYSLMHIGCAIPPQADAGWIGEIGPGPSYGDLSENGRKRIGFDSDYTNRNTTFMTWNLLHMARMIKDAGGIPDYGNNLKAWSDGKRFGFALED